MSVASSFINLTENLEMQQISTQFISQLLKVEQITNQLNMHILQQAQAD